jgi:hypothetical protein
MYIFLLNLLQNFYQEFPKLSKEIAPHYFWNIITSLFISITFHFLETSSSPQNHDINLFFIFLILAALAYGLSQVIMKKAFDQIIQIDLFDD